ncbi:hypothetical protein [Acinetobacter rathckeae]|uniref:hypothetical protein n=1 Tax=Acinetobacter rathckeae TaxID=2605272 RepID=UPI0018A2B4C2|nr:hypothetical protein [Acinetobacter rathckeae]MBF7687062.1 hypothetical protein [Acinetobacter rathckeae]
MSAVTERHIMQVMDWTKYSLEEWLYQFGAWQYSSSGTCGKSINPIAVAMDQAVVKRKKFKLDFNKQRQVIADYLTSDAGEPKARATKYTCQITDDEARAVQRLILDMMGRSEVLDEWLDAVIDRYFYGNSWAEIAVDKTVNDARQDVKCGLAALHVRYPFIPFGS